jgi:CheY-like chemotaxis protein
VSLSFLFRLRERLGSSIVRERPSRIRVLCVDDDSAFLDLTRAWLSRVDEFAVHTETDPQAALSTLREGTLRIDAVVSDYQMPEMDGLELLERVRDSHPDLPFVLFTNEGSESIASEAISAGVTDYLRKHGPDRFDLLVNQVRNAVASDRAKREAEHERHVRDRILESVPIGIVGHDRTGDVRFLNDRATEILAASSEELDGRAYGDAGWTLLTEAGDPVTPAELPYRRVVDTGARIVGERYRLRTSDGREERIVVYGSPLWNDAGTDVEGAVVAFHTTDEREWPADESEEE